MEDVAQRYFRKLGEKVANDDTYMGKVEDVRKAARISGIEEFNRDHMIGALFALTAIDAGASILHAVQMMDHQTMKALKTLADETAIQVVALTIGAP